MGSGTYQAISFLYSNYVGCISNRKSDGDPENSGYRPPFPLPKTLISCLLAFAFLRPTYLSYRLLKKDGGRIYDLMMKKFGNQDGKFPFLLPKNLYHSYYLKVLDDAQKVVLPFTNNVNLFFIRDITPCLEEKSIRRIAGTSIFQDFSSFSWSRQDEVNPSIEDGGLGFLNLDIFDKTLDIKWVCRVWGQDDSLGFQLQTCSYFFKKQNPVVIKLAWEMARAPRFQTEAATVFGKK